MTEDLKKRAGTLDFRFQTGASLYEEPTLSEVRSLPRPICVGLESLIMAHKTKVGAGYPGANDLVLNPEASKPLKALSQIGTLFIVAMGMTLSYEQYNEAVKVLTEAQIWHSGMVLFSISNYNRGLDQSLNDPHSPASAYENDRRSTIVREYIAFHKTRGNAFKLRDFDWHLCLAPVFKRPYEVPFIRGDYGRTNANPGMLTIPVKMFDPSESQYLSRFDADLPDLSQAVGLGQEHYSKVSEIN